MSAAPACPLCDGARAAPVGGHGLYALYDCRDCGAGFCAPFKNPGPEYYEHSPDLYPEAVAEGTDPSSFEYDEALALLRRILLPGAALLDVGCGAGGFLRRAREAGLRPSGLDFNARRVALLRERGFDAHAGSLPAFASRSAPGSFCAVTLFQVLEHLDDPAAWLAAARRLLRPDGLFILGTPNRARTFDPFQGPGMEQIDLPPHHLTRWSAAALSRFLRVNGFEPFECRPLGYPLPLLQLLLRNSLRLGLATAAMNVDQLRHATPGETSTARSAERALRALVAAKEAAINAVAWAAYPLFRLAYRALGWQGVVLFAAARPKLSA